MTDRADDAQKQRDFVLAYVLSALKNLLLYEDKEAALEKFKVAESHFHKMLAVTHPKTEESRLRQL